MNANAADNGAVAGVQFRLDGANLGAEDTSAPYSVSWDTFSVANGSHILSAIARDAAGNTTPATNVLVTASNTAPPGLVAAWAFDEASGTTTADQSGNGNDGTLVNATRVTTGKFNNALNFNGTNAWVSVADAASLDLTTGMTLEAWVRPSGRTAAGARCSSRSSPATSSTASTPTPNGTVPGGEISVGGSTAIAATAPATLPVGTLDAISQPPTTARRCGSS